MLIGIGYWRSDDAPWYPDPKNYVHPGWEAADRQGIIHYLRSGLIAYSWLGPSWCRFPECPPELDMGVSDLTDNLYIWPEGLAHYVEYHDVWLPEQFIQHIREHAFQLPESAVVTDPPNKKDWSLWKEYTKLTQTK